MTFDFHNIIGIHRLHRGQKNYSAPLLFKTYSQWPYGLLLKLLNHCNSKTHLLNNITLRVTDELLQRVTHNFTRDATRTNCSKIDYIVLYNPQESLQYSKNSFPYAEIVELLE